MLLEGRRCDQSQETFCGPITYRPELESAVAIGQTHTSVLDRTSRHWNVYSIERRKGRMVTKFIGQIESEARKVMRAAQEVSKQVGVKFHIREAATDNWRRPDQA